MNPRWGRHLWEGEHELEVQQALADRLTPAAAFSLAAEETQLEL